MSHNRAKSEPIASRPNQERRRAAFLRDRLSPRVRDLFTDLMADRKETGAYLESQCLKVAELTVRAEDIRARLEAMLAAAKGNDDAAVRSLATLINAVTRLESTARRAAADLGKIVPKPTDDDWGAIQDEADRLEQERRNSRPKDQQS